MRIKDLRDRNPRLHAQWIVTRKNYDLEAAKELARKTVVGRVHTPQLTAATEDING